MRRYNLLNGTKTDAIAQCIYYNLKREGRPRNPDWSNACEAVKMKYRKCGDQVKKMLIKKRWLK